MWGILYTTGVNKYRRQKAQVCKKQLNDYIRQYFYGKPSCYNIEQLILRKIQFWKLYPTEKISV